MQVAYPRNAIEWPPGDPPCRPKGGGLARRAEVSRLLEAYGGRAPHITVTVSVGPAGPGFCFLTDLRTPHSIH